MSDPCLSSQPTQSHRTSMPMSFVAGQGVVGRCLYGGQSGHGRCLWEWSFLDTGQEPGVVEGTGLSAPAGKLAAEAQTSIATEIPLESAALDPCHSSVIHAWAAAPES